MMQSKGGKIGEPQATCGGPVTTQGAKLRREDDALDGKCRHDGSGSRQSHLRLPWHTKYCTVRTTCPVRGKELR